MDKAITGLLHALMWYQQGRRRRNPHRGTAPQMKSVGWTRQFKRRGGVGTLFRP